MNEDGSRFPGVWLAIAGVVALVAGIYFAVRPEPGTVGGDSPKPESIAETGTLTADEPGSADDSGISAIDLPGGHAASGEVIHVLDVARNAEQLHREDGDALEDLGILHDLLGHYRRIHGANPEGGLNFEIVANLAGGNPRNLAVLPPNHPSLNPDGQLLDRWGTPYWFHPVSREVMEIVSAGPDKNLWTEDDVRLD